MKKIINEVEYNKASEEIGQINGTVQKGILQETLCFLAGKIEEVEDRELLQGLVLIIRSLTYDAGYKEVAQHLDNVFSGRLENEEPSISEIAGV